MTSEIKTGVIVPPGFEQDLTGETKGMFMDDTLNGIRQNAALFLAAKYGGTNTWKGPVVVDYEPHESVVGNSLVMDNDMLLDVCAILDPWTKSEMHVANEEIERGELALGIIVLQREAYSNSRVAHDRKVELHQKYGVVPLDRQHVLFQGLLRDVRLEDPGYGKNPNGLVFKYIPRDIITGGEIPRHDQEMQKIHAANYLAKDHPIDKSKTPFEKLIVQR